MGSVLRGALALVLVVVLSAGAGAVRADETLSGSYYGVDDGAGATIVIAPDAEGYRGTFHDRFGKSQDFLADRVGDAAEAILDMDGQTVLMRMLALPYGAQVSLIPFNPDGTLALEFARSVGFVREGISLPERPQDYVEAPRADCQRVAAYGFLSSYAFWQPAGVRNGYLCLPDRHRVLMRMFPALQLDVIWKLCLAPEAEPALALALRGQGVACQEVLEGIADAQRAGRFDAYKAEVEGERWALSQSVRCADGYSDNKATCDTAARRLARAAVELGTAAKVLGRYR